MKIVQYPDDLYNYLQLVIKRYAKGGIDPEEGQALFFLNDFTSRAQHIPDEEIAKANAVKVPEPPKATEETPVGPPLNDGVRSLKRGDVGA